MIEKQFRGDHDDAPDPHDDRLAIAPGKLPATARLLPRAILDMLRAADRSAGAPLPFSVQARFERSLDADLSAVRVHAGAASAAAAAAVGARAYAIGNDIHFAAGAYAPTDPFGLHLLAHEIAHTRQQARAPMRQNKLELGVAGDAAEVEADRAADAMIAGAVAAPIVEAPRGLARAEASATPATGGGNDKDEDLSALRKQLLAQFDQFNGAVVGDKTFDAIMTKDSWDSTKIKEQLQSAASAMTVGMVKPPAIFTTCVNTQGAMMVRALAACKLKPAGDHFDFVHQMKDNKDAWHPATAGMSERPRPGDTLIFAGRGGTIDRAEQGQRYAEGQTADAAKKEGQVADKVGQAQAALDTAKAAKAALDELAKVESDDKAEKAKRASAIMRATSAVNLANQTLANWSAMEKNTSKALAGAQDAEKKADAKVDDARATPHDARLFEFKHVCFLTGAISKTDDGKEQWPVFGGGATLTNDKGEAHQGAEKAGLIYDPSRNELTDPSGKAPTIWLQGWLDADKMATK